MSLGFFMALVVVGDFDVVGVATVPAEAEAVLVVDPDGMLAGAVGFKGVEFVVRWEPEIFGAAQRGAGD